MILVTGATGHIGNVLVRELLQKGESVRALVLPGEDCTPIQGLAVEKVEGDVLDPAALDRAMRISPEATGSPGRKTAWISRSSAASQVSSRAMKTACLEGKW